MTKRVSLRPAGFLQVSTLLVLGATAWCEQTSTPPPVGASPSTACNNGGQTCLCNCPPKPPEGASSGGSTILNTSGIYLHDAPIWSVADPLTTGGGCVPCGGASSGDGVKGLAPLSITRYYRSRNGGYLGSIGYNHYLSTDYHLRFDWSAADGTNATIRHFDPSEATIKRQFTEKYGTDQGVDGVFRDSVGLERDLRLYDAAGAPVASMLTARTAVVTGNDGNRRTFEIVDTGAGATTRIGRLVGRVDRTGTPQQVIAYAYPWDATLAVLGSNRLRLLQVATVTGADGTRAQYAYDQTRTRAGRFAVSRIDLPNGSSTSFTYLNDNLTAITLPDGGQATFTRSYDTALQKIKTVIADPAAEAGHQLKTVWWVGTSYTNPDGSVVGQVEGQTRRVDNAAGEIVYAAWSGATVANNSSDTYAWHVERGLRKLTVSSAAATVTSISYANGFVLGEDPFTTVFSDKETYSYDTGRELLLKSVDALGRATQTVTYNTATRRVLTLKAADGTTTTTTYNDLGEPLTITDRLGRVTTFTYDALGNRLSKTAGTGAATSTWSWTYDARGLVTAAIDANGNRTDYVYDVAGHLTTIREPADVAGGARAERTFAYDAAGQLIRTADAAGRTVVLAYDARGRVAKRTYDDGSVETFTYGTGALSGLLVAETNRNGVATTYAYDAAGRRATTTTAAGLPEAVTETCTYLPGSPSLKTACVRAGETTTYAYDLRRRLIGTTVFPIPGRALTATTTYDAISRLQATRDAFGRVSATVFDLRDRPVRRVRELVPDGIPAGSDLATLPRIATANPPYVIEETVYDAESQIISTIDGRGTRTERAYDSQGRSTSVTEAVGTPVAATTTFAYDAQGNQVAVTDPRGAVTASTFTGRNRAATVTEAAGTAIAATTTYAYSPTGKPLAITDALGRVTTNAYGVCCDRLVSVTDPLGFQTRFTYDSYGNRLTVTDANNLTTVTTFDGRHRPRTVTNPAGETTTLTYTDDASTLAKAAGLGLGAGADGSAVTTTNALGETTIEIRDGLGRLARRVDGLGQATTWAYDSVVADGGVTLVAQTATDPLGHATTQRADAAGRVRVALDALGKRSTAGFDANGNRLAWRDALGVGQDCAFDARNRDVSCTDTTGAVTARTYDANGNVVRTVDALSQAETATYDLRNRKTETTDRIGATTAFAYDAVSNLTRITDAQAGVTDYAYDARNLLVDEKFPTGQQGRTQRLYTYDPGRRLTRRVVQALSATGTASGAEPTTYAYDAANRLLTRGYADGKNDAFAYDTASRLTTATSARYVNRVRRTYDAASRLTSEILAFTSGADMNIDLPVRYGYDADNRVTSLTYPDGSVVRRDYTARDELFHVWDGAQVIATRAYDDAGRLTRTQLGNGLTETRTYVPNDHLVASISVPGVTGFRYEYDALKRKTAEIDQLTADQTQRFAYDAQARLTSWQRTGAAPTDPATATQTWTLSPVGDWTSSVTDGTTQTRTHTAVHEAVTVKTGSAAAVTLAYDRKGNLTKDDQGQTFAWDPENRLLAAGNLQQGQGLSATYAYDALGRRVRKAVTTAVAVGTTPAKVTTTTFVSAGAQEVIEITGDLTAFNDPATTDPESAGIRPYDPATGKGARGSLLDDADAQRFNAQPATTDTPDGWTADTGLATTAPARGWSSAVTGVDRDHLGRPLYDSFLPLGTATWTIPVANGTHAVVIMCGDADSRAQTNHLLVNGTALVDPTPYDGRVTNGYETGAFDGYALTVNVTNGLLTIKANTGALSPKITFIEIGKAGSVIDSATTTRVTAATTKATQETAKPKAKTPPLVKRNVWGTYVDELIGYTIQKPRYALGRYWVSSNHLFSLSAVTNGAGQVASGYSYDAYGRQTVRNAAGTAIGTSDPAGLGRGLIGYKYDAESGMYAARARMYSPKLGRFVSRDPLGYIDGSNTYAGKFIPNGLDPKGLFSFAGHYFWGGGRSVDLADVGILDTYRNAYSVRRATTDFKLTLLRMAWAESAKSIGCGEGKLQRTHITYADRVPTDVTMDIFAVGDSILRRSGVCTITTSCHKCAGMTLEGETKVKCSAGYWLRDMFKDPADIFDWSNGESELPGGTPYAITAFWDESYSDSIGSDPSPCLGYGGGGRNPPPCMDDEEKRRREERERERREREERRLSEWTEPSRQLWQANNLNSTLSLNGG